MKENNNRTRWVHLRLTPTEYRKLHTGFEKTTCRKLSDYLRSVIFEQPVIATYRNMSMDTAMEQMAILNKELNAIGNNINQMAKKMHTIRLPEMQHWSAQFEVNRALLFAKVDEVKTVLGKFAGQWLR
jgi:hypothetical protein